MESTTDFLEMEQANILDIPEENKKILKNIKDFITLLDKTEYALNEEIASKIEELENMNNISTSLTHVLKIIYDNLH